MASAGRQEETPAEQLEGLRTARDYYAALAEQIQNNGRNPSETLEDWAARERKARRFASAYEKSFDIQNRMMTPEIGPKR